jgi:hydroxymethylglutaryl-CoA lyase
MQTAQLRTRDYNILDLLDKQADVTRSIMRGIHAIEVGAFTSPKIIPAMQYTRDLLDYAYFLEPRGQYTILVPNHARFQKSLTDSIYQKVTGFSYITSASPAFQQKNTRQTLEETHKDIVKCVNFAGINKTAKVYVSCINHCPLTGRVHDEAIYAAIRPYIVMVSNGEIDEVCLADTCGTLRRDDFQRIIETLYMLGLPYENMGLHLHVSMSDPVQCEEARRILWCAFDRGVGAVDVATSQGGGCSVTIAADKIAPNLTHDFYEECWHDWCVYRGGSGTKDVFLGGCV